MKKFLSLALVCILFTSCATTISTTVKRPAKADLNGASSIAVLPFGVSGTTNIDSSGYFIIDFLTLASSFANYAEPDEVRLSELITSSLTSKISQSGYYTLVSSSSVSKALSLGKVPPVDAYVTGQITKFSHYTSTRKEKIYLDEKKENFIYETYFTRHVEVSIMYQTIDAKTNRVLFYNTRSYNASSSETKDRQSLESPYSIIESRMRNFVLQVMKEIEPYSEVVKIKLLKDKSHDLYMKTAYEFAKIDEREEARALYLKQYELTGNFVAAYNAALLYQADGELEEAESILALLVEKTYDKRAVKALSKVEYEIAQREKLKKQEEARKIK